MMRNFFLIGLNKYLNIFRCLRIDRKNIQTYLDAQQMPEQIKIG